jgi:hypothetical protein
MVRLFAFGESMADQQAPLEKACEVFGFGAERYRQLAKAGLVPKTDRGKIPFLAACKAVIDYYRAAADGGDETYHAERTRLTKAQADVQELKLERERGEVIGAADAMRLWGEIMATFKVRLTSIPRKIAPVAIGCANIIEIQEVLDAEISAALGELSEPDLRAIASKAGIAPAVGSRRPGTAPGTEKADGKRVGGPKQGTQPGGKRGARKVVHGKGGVPKGDSGRLQRPADTHRGGNEQRPNRKKRGFK